MKLSEIFIPISIVATGIIIAGVANNYLGNLLKLQQKNARSQAVDGCMEIARYSWQATNQQNPGFTDTTTEPNRYWYKICMQEKGFEIATEI